MVTNWTPTMIKTDTSSVLAQIVHDYLSQGYPDNVLTWVLTTPWVYGGFVELSSIESSDVRPGGPFDKKTLKHLKRAQRQHDVLAPIVLVKVPDSALYKIADGWHRVAAGRADDVFALTAYVAKASTDNGPWGAVMNESKLND